MVKKKVLLITSIFILSVMLLNVQTAYAFPFYNLSPKPLTLRQSFYTSYNTSTPERKHNIYIASLSLDKTMIDVGGEFSFNKTVGERTQKRGYKQAKIIVGGEFIDGVGGGVCQVSTTLYNAVLLAGLKITEYHPHSLPVSYVAPSFDAMVNSSYADLRFVNNTTNPIIIRAFANGEKLTIEIYGEKNTCKIERKSQIIEEIPIPEQEILIDTKGEFPTLLEGETKVLSYGKKGYRSVGYIVVTERGKTTTKLIRKDTYKPTKQKIVIGTAKPL